MFYNAIIKKEGNVYGVSFPDLKGCYSQGDTLEEAKAMAKEALNGYLVSSISESFDIPEAKYNKGTPVAVSPEIVFALQLRKLRGNKTQKEVAEKLGISYQAYQKLEKAKSANPTLKTVEKVAEIFGKSVELTLV